MLTKKDIELLAEVFSTKADLEKLASKEDVTFIRSDLNSERERQQNFEEKTEAHFAEIKKDNEAIRETLQEFIVNTDNRINKNEKWNKLIAEKVGISLQ